MKKKTVAISLCTVLLAVTAACFSEEEPPLNPTGLTQSSLTVKEGFTAGTVDPIWNYLLGELSCFTLNMPQDDQALWFEVRASEEPITTENWYYAIPMATVEAHADTANVFVQVEVEEEPCIGCGLCEQACPMGAITVQGGVAVIDYDLCTACGQCQDVCPVDAVSGTRFDRNYYFAVRAFYGENSPADEITVCDQAYRLVYFNAFSTFGPDPGFQKCQRCVASEDSLGCYAGCFVLNDWADRDRTVFTGEGCPEDAIWQDSDTLPVGGIINMIYIDYDDCISCGQCFLECWNYEQRINPDPNAYMGFKSFKRRVVPANWVPEVPDRPSGF